jgi:hypothetical protein
MQSKIIDAELEQKKALDARYKIPEVPINDNPCTDACKDFRLGDCPEMVWSCPKYRKYRSEWDVL